MKEEKLELETLRREKAELALRVERLACERNEQALQIEYLQEQLKSLQLRLYGRKSERFENPAQRSFFDLMPELQVEAPAPPRPEPETITYTRRRREEKRGPKSLPDHLERIEIAVDPPAEERVCACCSKDMERVGETVTEELDIVPPKFRVNRYVQGKYCCTNCMNRDVQKDLPPRPIQNGRPSPSLLAYLVVSKYVDHCPLHRQEQIFRRHGVELARSTMDEWFGQLSRLLLAIVAAMRRRSLASGYLQCDETPIDAIDREPVRRTQKKRNGKRQMRRCYAWAYSIPRGEVIYDVTPSRSGDGPRAFLEGFAGYLQTDGYVGYDQLFESGRRQRVACMAHIRRKFFEGRQAAPERTERILDLIRGLYAVEAEARDLDLDPEARLTLREEKSQTIFERLREEIDELAPIPVPKSKLGKAVSYAKSQWPAMARYLEDGRLEIDNNRVEQAMRPAVLGRKNYLFLGSVKGGGERAQVFYTLTQSAKRLGIEPFAYLEDVIARIASHPMSRIDELTPLGWKLERERAEKAVAGSAP